ncbi:hypothetical protein RhiTH_010347 [Rhizoctonia solani]
MLSSVVAAFVLAASVNQVAASPSRHLYAARAYSQDAHLLEDYETYHGRYLSIGCSSAKKNDQAFFEECCHPLHKGGESSSDKCNASSNPTTPAAPQPTTSAYAAAASPASSNSETYSGGVATYYYQNGAAGSCGNYNSDDTPIVAVDSRTMDPSLCGKKVRVTNTNNGKSVVCTIADTCPTCNTATSLDLSTGAFNQIAKPEEGMVPIAWHFE